MVVAAAEVTNVLLLPKEIAHVEILADSPMVAEEAEAGVVADEVVEDTVVVVVVVGMEEVEGVVVPLKVLNRNSAKACVNIHRFEIFEQTWYVIVTVVTYMLDC